MIESVQYNAALAITGTMLGLESFHDRRWHRKRCFYYQIRHNICPSYLTELLPIEKSTCHNFRSNDSLMIPYFRKKQFKSTFFPFCIFNWNQLNPDIKNSSSLEIFKRALLKFIRPKAANVYKIHHPRGLKLLSGNNHHYKRRKITEAFYIKEMKPNLNVQVQSHPLYLFR